MQKYLMIWSLNRSLIPVNPQERGEGYALLMEAVRKDMEMGLTKEWGNFIGESKGFCVVEGTEVEVLKMVQQYSPYCEFTTHPIASAGQVSEMINSL